jgi:porphobilinogen synthase
VRETVLSPDRFIYPLFVQAGDADREPIESMPGQFRYSVEALVEEVLEASSLGIGGVILFGLPESKDPLGHGAYSDDGIVQRAIRAIRKAGAEVVVAADVCLCEYTDHGHCGVLEGDEVRNDETLELLARTAASLADAGVDIVAPSAMMDGQVKVIRSALDGGGHTDVGIMAYSAKYASAFYGPFREAADSAPRSGDRRAYQMLKAAGERSWLDDRAAAVESLTAIARAGADILITYFAKEVAEWLRK